MRTLTKNEQVIYLDYEQAQMLAERIGARAGEFWQHCMSEAECEAMANLLACIGVRVEDMIDISNLADNYAVNGEFIDSENIRSNHASITDDMNEEERADIEDDIDREIEATKDDCLFWWEEDGKTTFCLRW
jgi:hypothetical protein